MRNLKRSSSSGPALSRDNLLAVFNHLQLCSGPQELRTITLQTDTKASGSTHASMAVFVFDKFSAYKIHLLQSLFLLLKALIQEAFLEGGN